MGLSPSVCVPGLVQGTLAVTYLLGWFLSFCTKPGQWKEMGRHRGALEAVLALLGREQNNKMTQDH